MRYTNKFMLVMAIATCLTGCGDSPVNTKDKTEVKQTVKATPGIQVEHSKGQASKTEVEQDGEVKTEVEQGGEVSLEIEEAQEIALEEKSKEDVESVSETEQIENEYFAFNIPKGWKKSPININDNIISIMKSKNEAIDVMVLQGEMNLDQITMEEYKNNIQATMSAQQGCTLNKIEVQKRGIGEIIYVEMKSLITKELVEVMIDSGLVKQETVDAVGGANIYAKALSLEEAAAYYIYDNNLLIIDGKCADNGDIEEVKKQVNKIIDTIKVK